LKNALKFHESTFNKPQIIINSPGRVNILGEHTDYNGGTVLPFAIHKKTQLILSESSINTQVYSHLYQEKINLDRPENQASWGKYIIQVVSTFKNSGIDLKHFNATIHGDLPAGQGLSSSTSLTCGIIAGLNQLFNLSLTTDEIINFSSRAEHASGTLGGIMDQTAIMYSKRDHFLKINCSDNNIEALNHSLNNSEWLIINSKVDHELSGSGYNLRREQCNLGLQSIHEQYSKELRFTDLTIQHLGHLNSTNKTSYKRLLHFIEEQERVKHALVALKNNNPQNLGKLLYQCHQSLSENYEVSTPEIDFLVEELINHHAVYGARMVGGGFGGSVLALIQKGMAPKIKEETFPKYLNTFNLEAEGFLCYPCNGLQIQTL